MRPALFVLATVVASGVAHAQTLPPEPARPSGPLQQKLVPGMAVYTDEVLFKEVWPGAELSQRDRSLVVISVLIATHKPALLQGHLARALDNGVTPVEASGVLTHLAFYAGWPNAVSALAVYDQVYTSRNVDFGALQSTAPERPPAVATPSVNSQLRTVAPDFAELTERVVENDLWQRSDLSVRDRSLVTIATLAAMGDAELLNPYLRRAVEAGLTRDEIAAALTHLAFYAGWGKATAALQSVEQPFGSALQSAAPPTGTGTRISRQGSAPVTAGSAENFTGTVRVLAPFRGSGGSRLGGATVRFEPGARSAWHRHPLGQALIVTEGCGWTQAEGGPIEKICAGDVAWIGPEALARRHADDGDEPRRRFRVSRGPERRVARAGVGRGLCARPALTPRGQRKFHKDWII